MSQAAILRILDANQNRAREALRVAEEYARFVLEDADAAGQIKHLRHELHAWSSRIPPAAALAERDIEHDVGAALKAPGELSRESAAQVAAAALARFGEAARVLCEYVKTLDAALGQHAERLRYEGYRLEALLLARGDRRRRFATVRLYVLITESACRASWVTTAEAALAGGAGALQLREKSLTDRELLARARTLRDLTRRHAALLILNDRPDLARLCDADGVHVGQEDLSVADARRIVGQDRLVGCSTHTASQFDQALRERPDYVAVGPIFASPTKPNPQLAGLERLRELTGRTELPVVAIGGITAANAATAFAAGARCVAVCAAVAGAEDARAAAAAIVAQQR